MEKKNRKNRHAENKEIVNSMIHLWQMENEVNPIDVLGSYSGTPYGYDDIEPEQDADDL